MNKTFKPGDLVFELDFVIGFKLTVLKTHDTPTYTVKGSGGIYTARGLVIYNDTGIPSLLHATQEMREKLVAIWGEDAVPKLPVRGSELTKKLLAKQKYVLCLVSHNSDDAARKHRDLLAIIDYVDDKKGWFSCTDEDIYNHAVPVDIHGNEITEIEE